MSRHSGLAARIAACASNPDADPSHLFDRPQILADARSAGYEDRLAVLQRWRSWHPDNEEAVAAAIRSLEMGAVLGTDEPEGAPRDWGYGARSRD